MSCRILVLPVVGCELLASFSEPPNEPDDWAALASDLVRYSRQDRSIGSEAYLCFLGDQIPNRPAVDRLQGLLDSARSHAWGSQTFLVTRWDLEVHPLRQNRAAMLKWLESAREGRSADVLQVYDPSSPVSLDPRKLQEARDQTAARRSYLHRALHCRWSCKVRPERQGLARLLEGEAWMPLPLAPPDQLLVVVDRSESNVQMPLIEEAWDDAPGRCLVATLQVDASDELIGFCREHGVEILAFSGVLELWHFFLRLNDDRFGSCQEVSLDRLTPVFHWPESEPSVLFTNAWNPDAGMPERILQAARDWGTILAGAPLAIRSLVDLAVTRDRLFEQVDFLEGPLIWLHTGPGYEGGSLVDASGRQVSAETWLGCFKHGSRLPVAVFLCGGSAPVARRFAAAGAGIAIGFEGAELSCRSQRLAIDMLHVALQTGGSREAVLRAWNAELTTSDMSRPRAYYSR